jgi:hypothetical protein
MAYENVTLANTQKIAVDDVGGGILVPITKLDVGGDGASVPLVGTALNGLPVDVTRIQNTVTVAWTGAPTVSISGTVPVSGSVAVASLPASVTGGGRTLQTTPFAHPGTTGGVTGTATAVVAAQGAGLKIKVFAVVLNNADPTADTQFRIMNGTTDFVGSSTQPMRIGPKQGFALATSPEGPFWVTAANTALNFASTALVPVSGFVAWYAEA